MGLFRQLKDLRTASEASSVDGTARVISSAAPTDDPEGELTVRVELHIDGTDTDSCVIVTSVAVPANHARKVVVGAELAMRIEGSGPAGVTIDWGN